jgi:GMP synthase (glutamine-hydrolysing)
LGGSVVAAKQREYGKVEVSIDKSQPLFQNIHEKTNCWMSHTYHVDTPPEGFTVTAKSSNCPVGAMQHVEKNFHAVQFHPEVVHTPKGKEMLRNFLYSICGCKGDWQMSAFVENSIKAIREKVGDKKVLCALSGGVDSSVAAVLINKAIGKQLTCIFVDHGLLRKHEGDQVEQVFRKQYDINMIRVNCEDRFLGKLEDCLDDDADKKQREQDQHDIHPSPADLMRKSLYKILVSLVTKKSDQGE